MFNQSEYSEIKNIILKISKNQSVSLNERMTLQGYINKHSEIQNLFKKAQCSRRFNNRNIEDLTKFMADLGLNGTFQEEHFNPQKNSIEEWFTNAPPWLKRS
tara:strand:- start:1051 stop:1356 length:306 start_codon:yes stop_codon:yes gene_type:complete